MWIDILLLLKTHLDAYLFYLEMFHLENKDIWVWKLQFFVLSKVNFKFKLKKKFTSLLKTNKQKTMRREILSHITIHITNFKIAEKDTSLHDFYELKYNQNYLPYGRVWLSIVCFIK